MLWVVQGKSTSGIYHTSPHLHRYLNKTWLLISNRAQSITQSEDPDAIEMEPQTLLETARVSVPASGPEPGRISRVPRPANEPELSRIQIERAQFGLKLLYDGDDAQVE